MACGLGFYLGGFVALIFAAIFAFLALGFLMHAHRIAKKNRGPS